MSRRCPLRRDGLRRLPGLRGLPAARWALAAIAATALTGPATAQASPRLIDLPETPAQLELEPRWQAQELPALPAGSDVLGPARLVALYREAAPARPRAGDPALSLVVLRFDAPNPRAWRASTRDAYLDEIEAAVVAACGGAAGTAAPDCRGFKPQRRTFELEAVPGMELIGKDGRGATRMVRFLFFRTYAIVAALEVPARARAATVKRARGALAGFTVMASWQR